MPLAARHGVIVLAALSAAAFANPARAAESYDNCAGTISSLPAVLTTQGVWCLKSDLSTAINDGYAILVEANNVTIDCNGFKLGGLAAGPSSWATGIYAQDRLNTVVRDCNVRGFLIGIRSHGGGGHVVEDNRLEGNLAVGIHINSPGSSIRRNRVIDTGGAAGMGGTTIGILAAGGVEAIDNTIFGVTLQEAGFDLVGLSSSTNHGGTIAGNRIGGLASPAPVGVAFGILDTSTDAVIAGNHLFGPPAGTGIAIQCQSPTVTSTGNTINGFGSGAVGCHEVDDIFNPN